MPLQILDRGVCGGQNLRIVVIFESYRESDDREHFLKEKLSGSALFLYFNKQKEFAVAKVAFLSDS